MTLASRIAVMHLGEVQQFDEPEVVSNRPANMCVAGFMGSPSMNFIDAEFMSANGAPAVGIAVGQGNTASLPLHNGAAGRAGTGKVILGVRPEHLSRYRQDVHGSKPGIATLTAPVEVVGRFSPDEAPKMGEQMQLAVDMTRACLFDPSTQRLI
jgi:multiple sugar transport system ATP-binding protein